MDGLNFIVWNHSKIVLGYSIYGAPCKPIMSLYWAQENNSLCDTFLFLFIVISSLTCNKKAMSMDSSNINGKADLR